MYKPYHAIGLELGISVAAVGLRREATGRGHAAGTATSSPPPSATSPPARRSTAKAATRCTASSCRRRDSLRAGRPAARPRARRDARSARWPRTRPCAGTTSTAIRPTRPSRSGARWSARSADPARSRNAPMPLWSLLLPAAAAALLGVAIAAPMGTLLTAACAAALVGAVIAAVHHAEVVAHRVGEPFGTLVLALAVTVIEVRADRVDDARGRPARAGLARDTVFAAVMIICNGIVGMCLLLGRPAPPRAGRSDRGRQRGARRAGRAGHADAGAAECSRRARPAHLHRVAARVRRRSPRSCCGRCSCSCRRSATATTSSRGEPRRGRARAAAVGRHAWASFGLLLVALVAVVGLAKMLSPRSRRPSRAGAPKAVVGIVIAMLVLLPEGWPPCARRARTGCRRASTWRSDRRSRASASRFRRSPLVSILLGLPLVLGLEPKDRCCWC